MNARCFPLNAWRCLGAAFLWAALAMASPANGALLSMDFEDGVDGWKGVSASPSLHMDDMSDWPDFCRILANNGLEGSEDPFAARVWERLPASAREVAEQAAASDDNWLSEESQAELAEALNTLLLQRDLFAEGLRSKEPARSVAALFVERDFSRFSDGEAALFNRLVLEAVFPYHLERWRRGSDTVVESRDLPVGGARQGRGLYARPYLSGQSEVDFLVASEMDWRTAGQLRFDAYVPAASGGRVQALVYVLDQDSLWYQTSTPRDLRLGDWARVAVDASPSSAEWEPHGHARPWSAYAGQELRALGIKVFGANGVGGGVYLDNLVLEEDAAPPQPLRILNFSLNAQTVPKYERFEVAFELNRAYDNPFDPEEVDVRGVFISPSGLVHFVPGFFYQDFERHFSANVEHLTPRGHPSWRIRYAPREIGKHRYFIEIQERDQPKRRFFREPRQLECVPSDNPGFVRVSSKDWRCFEFEDGDYFYPVGYNIPASYNEKNAEALGMEVLRYEGTFAYDRFLDGMERGEMNFARIWLASWSFGLEWSRNYSWEYRDVGRYNLRNAWRLDYVLDGCRRRDIYVQLALTTFGHFRSQVFEGDWPYSPYNKENGGHLSRPEDFWTCERSQKYYQRMLRYVAARWGYSTHIMSWEISNEIDLVTNYNRVQPHIVQWHRDCVATLQRYDQGRRLVTTNFANWTRDPDILKLPEISYSSTNRYARSLMSNLRRVYEMKSEFRKPVFMAECGDDFKGSTAQITKSYIPISLWGSFMMPLAGAGTQWWWDFIEDRNLYHLFRPLARFARGEDRRDPSLKMRPAKIADHGGPSGEKGLAAECLGSPHRAYFWVYEQMLQRPDEEWSPSPRRNAAIELEFLADGEYEVEFWHTIEGEVIGTEVFPAKGGKLRVALPEFVNHVAAKVRPAPGSEETGHDEGLSEE